MSHHCHDNSCCHDDHCHDQTCCSPQDKHSGGHDCHSHSHTYADKLLELADAAWMELVKEEIKKEILKSSGEHISKLAALVSKTNHARWHYKLDEKKNHAEYEEELKKIICCRK